MTAQIPSYMIPFSAEQFVQQAVNCARTKYWYLLYTSDARKKRYFLNVQKRFLRAKKELCLEEANLNIPETNGGLNFEAFSFLLNIILDENPVFIENNDNVYAYQRVGITNKDFHHLRSLIDSM